MLPNTPLPDISLLCIILIAVSVNYLICTHYFRYLIFLSPVLRFAITGQSSSPLTATNIYTQVCDCQ
jgi:hypothetical protein